jgi:site-specific DNA-methyltransferase (adenine-specific)
MKSIPDKSVDAVITDPPYVLPSKTSTSTKMAERFNKRNVGDLSIVEGYWRAWFDEVRRVLKPTGKFAIFCDEVLYTVLFRASYNYFDTSMLVWQKGKRVGLGRNYRKTFELIIYGKSTDALNFDEFRRDIIDIDIPSKKVHPAEKPTELIEYLIKPEEWQAILDPFMGSGTTGVACVQTGRNFIGIEIDEGYFKIAEKRINEAKQQMRIEFPVAKD